jgi:peroxiredoxin
MPKKQQKDSGQQPAAAPPAARQLPVWLGPVIIVAIVAVFWLPQILSDPAAKINGETISKADLDRRVAFERLYGDWTGKPAATSGAEAARFRSQVLDQMIENRMVMQEAKKVGVTATTKDVADAVASFQAQLGMTDAQMAQDLSRVGLTRTTLDGIMREDVLIDRYLRTVVMKGMTDEEKDTSIRNWYNETLQKARIEKHIESGGVKVGQAAPDFTLNDLDGKPVRLSDYKGKAVFVNFFATWCTPCRSEMPDIEAVWKANKDNGLVVLAVNLTNQDDLGDVQQYIRDLGLTFPVVLDQTGSVAALYRVVPIPTSFFIDRNGVVVTAEIRALARPTMEQRVAKIM